jgi:hypothetical protein
MGHARTLMVCTSETSSVCLVHLVGLVYLVDLVHLVYPLVSFNQIDKTNQANQLNETDQTDRTDHMNKISWRTFSASCWSFHDPQRIAGRVTQQLIGDASAEEPFQPVRTLTADHNSPIAAGPRFVENSMCDIVFVSELQRDTIQRKSGFPEQLPCLYQNRVLHHAFRADPVPLILL